MAEHCSCVVDPDLLNQDPSPVLNIDSQLCLLGSVADPGCLSRIPDPTFFHPGSRIRTISIPDPGSQVLIKEFKKAKKMVYKL
jgi:hypothetical protein